MSGIYSTVSRRAIVDVLASLLPVPPNVSTENEDDLVFMSDALASWYGFDLEYFLFSGQDHDYHSQWTISNSTLFLAGIFTKLRIAPTKLLAWQTYPPSQSERAICLEGPDLLFRYPEAHHSFFKTWSMENMFLIAPAERFVVRYIRDYRGYWFHHPGGVLQPASAAFNPPTILGSQAYRRFGREDWGDFHVKFLGASPAPGCLEKAREVLDFSPAKGRQWPFAAKYFSRDTAERIARKLLDSGIPCEVVV